MLLGTLPFIATVISKKMHWFWMLLLHVSQRSLIPCVLTSVTSFEHCFDVIEIEIQRVHS